MPSEPASLCAVWLASSRSSSLNVPSAAAAAARSSRARRPSTSGRLRSQIAASSDALFSSVSASVISLLEEVRSPAPSAHALPRNPPPSLLPAQLLADLLSQGQRVEGFEQHGRDSQIGKPPLVHALHLGGQQQHRDADQVGVLLHQAKCSGAIH